MRSIPATFDSAQDSMKQIWGKVDSKADPELMHLDRGEGRGAWLDWKEAEEHKQKRRKQVNGWTERRKRKRYKWKWNANESK